MTVNVVEHVIKEYMPAWTAWFNHTVHPIRSARVLGEKVGTVKEPANFKSCVDSKSGRDKTH